MATTESFIVGDVIEDSYANPAVVISVDAAGKPTRIMQCAGSDRGRITMPPRYIRRISGQPAEWARDIARTEWREGRRW